MFINQKPESSSSHSHPTAYSLGDVIRITINPTLNVFDGISTFIKSIS